MQDVHDVVLVAQLGSGHAPPTSALGAELLGRDRLDVAPGGQRDDALVVVDEVLDVELAGVDDEAGPAGRAELLLDLGQLVLDHLPQPVLVGEDRLELGDLGPQPAQLLLHLRAPTAG